jgi:hypothetical protein
MENKQDEQKVNVSLDTADVALIVDVLTTLSNERIDLFSQTATELEDKDFVTGNELKKLLRASFSLEHISKLILAFIEHLPESEDKASVIESAKANIEHHQTGIETLLGFDLSETNESYRWN